MGLRAVVRHWYIVPCLTQVLSETYLKHRVFPNSSNSLKSDNHLDLTRVPSGLTLIDSAFYPLRVFMCFIWYSGKTAILSLSRISRYLFVKEKKNVFYEVGNEFVYVIQKYFRPPTLSLRNNKNRWTGHVVRIGTKGMHIGFWWEGQKERDH
jgi:hypothetical protein